ncbi:hypothetical protein ACFQ9U_32525 [Streptomyces sp. NPDC056568]|uniref:hypothetical protein n=1 Tax=Streptomyces sp. NPDC056568 TaxID=3345866 RepID=UPI00368BB720
MQPTDSPDAFLRSATEGIARRVTGEKSPATALRSVLELVDNDEAELALDELARVIEYFRIPIRPEEYDQLEAAATRLYSMDSLLESGVERPFTASLAVLCSRVASAELRITLPLAPSSGAVDVQRHCCAKPRSFHAGPRMPVTGRSPSRSASS